MASKEEQSKKISSKIKELRSSQGWNQAQLASEAKITAAALSKIESGTGRIPTIVVLRKLAKALRVPVSEITGESSDASYSTENEVTNFYRKWGGLEELSEEDQNTLMELAKRLKGPTEK